MTNIQNTLHQRLDIKDALRQVPLFVKLPETELLWLCDRGQEVWREPGEIHRQEGDPADYVFILLEGEIRITQQARPYRSRNCRQRIGHSPPHSTPHFRAIFHD